MATLAGEQELVRRYYICAKGNEKENKLVRERLETLAVKTVSLGPTEHWFNITGAAKDIESIAFSLKEEFSGKVVLIPNHSHFAGDDDSKKLTLNVTITSGYFSLQSGTNFGCVAESIQKDLEELLPIKNYDHLKVNLFVHDCPSITKYSPGYSCGKKVIDFHICSDKDVKADSKALIIHTKAVLSTFWKEEDFFIQCDLTSFIPLGPVVVPARSLVPEQWYPQSTGDGFIH